MDQILAWLGGWHAASIGFIVVFAVGIKSIENAIGRHNQQRTQETVKIIDRLAAIEAVLRGRPA